MVISFGEASSDVMRDTSEARTRSPLKLLSHIPTIPKFLQGRLLSVKCFEVRTEAGNNHIY
jgi:hypothetical protein